MVEFFKQKPFKQRDKKISSKEDRKELTELWQEYLETLKIDIVFIGFSGVWRLYYWSIFDHVRFVYFMQMCLSGMYIKFAWRKACEEKKEDLIEFLKTSNWSL